jgi:hypothetical protein
MSKQAMREETERLVKEALERKTLTVKRGDRRRNGREHAEGGRRLLVLLAVLARVRGAEFDLAVHAGER